MPTNYTVLANKAVYPVSPVNCGREVCEPHHSFGPATRDYYLLHFILSGKGKFTTPRGTVEVGENELFVIRPYEISYYEADEAEPWEYIWIGFHADVPLPSAILTQDVIAAPYLRSYFLSACRDESFDDEDTNGAYEYYLSGIVWQMLGLFMRGEPAEKSAGESYVQAAVSIIESEYHTGLTVSELAARLHLNRSYLTRLFKQVKNVTPREYLCDFRMKRAAEFLTQRGFQVSVTATSVGFADVFVFSRAFKKHFGYSPTAYVKLK